MNRPYSRTSPSPETTTRALPSHVSSHVSFTLAFVGFCGKYSSSSRAISIARGRPFGHDGWIETAARRLNLQSTLRNRGRPRKFPRTAK